MRRKSSITKQVRERVKSRFGGKCGYCGILSEKIQIDHIQPVEYGGTDDESNLMPACFKCNNYKFTHGIESFREQIHRQVEKARKYSINYRTAERFGLVQEIKVEKIVFYFERAEEVEE